MTRVPMALAPQVLDADRQVDALQRPTREALFEALDVHILQPAGADVASGQLCYEDVGGLGDTAVHVAQILEREQRGGIALHEVVDLGFVVPLQGLRQVVLAHGPQHEVVVREQDPLVRQGVRVPGF